MFYGIEAETVSPEKISSRWWFLKLAIG